MRFYAGLDLGKRESQVKVIGEDRKVIEEIKIENTPETFKRIFGKYGKRVDVACEATSNAFWVADLLEPIVRKVHVGDTKKIRWIAEARIKTDKIDAGILAELLRADLFPEICIPPKRIRELRELVRGLARLRRQGVRLRNQVHGILGRHGVLYERKKMAGKKLEALVGEAKLAVPVQTAAGVLLAVEQSVHQQGKVLEKAILGELEGEAEVRKTVDLLESIPGVGLFSAVLFVLELWDIQRFRDPRHLASYIGFVPSTYQTGQTEWHGRMTKQGNALLRWILVQDAWMAARKHPFFGKLYERHRRRIGGTRAIVPVARMLLGTIHRVWTEGKTYEGVFGNKALVG
jgi:transposase